MRHVYEDPRGRGSRPARDASTSRRSSRPNRTGDFLRRGWARSGAAPASRGRGRIAGVATSGLARARRYLSKARTPDPRTVAVRSRRRLRCGGSSYRSSARTSRATRSSTRGGRRPRRARERSARWRTPWRSDADLARPASRSARLRRRRRRRAAQAPSSDVAASAARSRQRLQRRPTSRIRELFRMTDGTGGTARLRRGSEAARDRGYRAFEDIFRGSEEFIRERQRAYVDLLRGHEPVLDVGCGRGELLDLLREAGIEARAIDIDEGMVEHCREKGLDVVARRRDGLPQRAGGRVARRDLRAPGHRAHALRDAPSLFRARRGASWRQAASSSSRRSTHIRSLRSRPSGST